MAKQLRGPNAPLKKNEKVKEPSEKDIESKDKRKEERRKAPKKDGGAIESKWLKLPDKVKNLTTDQSVLRTLSMQELC